MKHVTDKEFLQILKEQPTNEDLVYLIKQTNKAHEAWEQLKAQYPTSDDLISVMESGLWLDEAWGMLKKKSLTKSQLITVIRKTDKRDEAAEILMGNNPNLSDLVTIRNYCSPQLKYRANSIIVQISSGDVKRRMMDVVRTRHHYF